MIWKKRSLIVQAMVLAIASSLLTACAQRYEGRYDYADGWRVAIVERVAGQRALLASTFPDDYSEAIRASVDNNFALVTYRVLKGKRTHIVQLPAQASVEAGDRLYINIRDEHIEAVLPAHNKN
jgi:hypothetical protein